MQERGRLRDRQGEQRLAQGDEPIGLGGGDADCLPQLLRAATGSGGQFQLALEDGQRRAQFVAGVGEEVPLLGRGRLQPLEHGVEGFGEPGQLVACARDRQPVVTGHAAHRRGLRAQPFDRPQGRSGEQVGTHAGQQHRHPAQHEQLLGRAGGGVVDRVEAGAHDDHPTAVTERLAEQANPLPTGIVTEKREGEGVLHDERAAAGPAQLERGHERGVPGAVGGGDDLSGLGDDLGHPVVAGQ